MYLTDGVVEIKSILYSLLNLSTIISICNKPRKPHLKPKPRAIEVSGTKVKEASFNCNFSKASLNSS